MAAGKEAEHESLGVARERSMRKMPEDGRLPFIPIMMPTLADKPPAGGGWIHEVKFDGYRTQLVNTKGARFFTRRGFDCRSPRR
ncbi:hypothetical protein BPNPMPFG_002279 [Mesorhizobium sp. AR07]|uniref:hypothetical protein n=1 Tax=Mesorhizobium sp. AR07 TaxID=2865838 RepID=UPI00215FB9B8|nr:hypothetical protein [Mesorhizobium sp. AR07]UVK46594.1 hypothetical protein BPNPMPFG_002279 [Mesorhizobium sp. AR07]